MTNPEHANDGFFERPIVIQSIQIGLVVTCVGLVLAEFGYEHYHPHFELETKFGFQAWLGFGAFVAAVALGTLLRMIVARPEEYYENGDIPNVQMLPEDDDIDHHGSGDDH